MGAVSAAAETGGLAAAFAALAANGPPGEVLALLAALEPAAAGGERARLLVARAIAVNRLGLASEALGDLQEALALAGADRPDIAAEAWRAIARIHAWRGGGREAALALLQMLALDHGGPEGRDAALAQALLGAGRIEMEIGRPDRAVALLRGGARLLPPSAPERSRALLELAQSALAAGSVATAAEALAAFAALPEPPTARQRHLALLARARLALAAGDTVSAQRRLEEAAALAPADPEAFEHIERAHAAAEIALARGDAAGAAVGLRTVVARLAADDLAGPEIEARLLEAAARDALGDGAGADRTLAAALRRARAAELGACADRVRERFVLRGRPLPDQDPFATAEGAVSLPASSRFVRRRPLGAGGAASVWRAYDLETGREVALKRLNPPGYELESPEQWLGEARREAFAATLIRHPGVARVFGLAFEGETAEEALLIRELVEGRDLRRRMSETWPHAAQLRALADVAWAIAAIHAAGLAHGDIKPENVVIRPNGRAVVIDLGASGAGSRAERTPLAAAYASPERRAGAAASARDDLHAFAVTAVEVLTGTRPVAGRPSWAAFFGRRRAREALLAELAASGLPADAALPLAQTLTPRLFAAPPPAAAIALALEGALSAARPR